MKNWLGAWNDEFKSDIVLCPLCENTKTTYFGIHPDFLSPIFECNYCKYAFATSLSEQALHFYYSFQYRQTRRETLSKRYLAAMQTRAKSQIGFILDSTSFEKSNLRSVEIGAGAGEVSLLLKSEFGFDTFASEYDRTFRKHIKDFEKARLVSGLEELPSSSFDLAFMSHVLEHLTDPLAYLTSVWRLLRPGGLLFIEVPNEFGFLARKYLETGKKGVGHLHFFSRESLMKTIERHGGFSILSHQYAGIDCKDWFRGMPLKFTPVPASPNSVWLRALLKKKDNSVPATQSDPNGKINSEYLQQKAAFLYCYHVDQRLKISTSSSTKHFNRVTRHFQKGMIKVKNKIKLYCTGNH